MINGMTPDRSNGSHASHPTISIKDKIFRDRMVTIIPDLNNTKKYGQDNAKIQRHLIVLYLANVLSEFKEAGKRERDSLTYFSGPELEKVVNRTYKEWKLADRIKFDGPRAKETYKICQYTYRYVEIETPKNQDKYFRVHSPKGVFSGVLKSLIRFVLSCLLKTKPQL